MTAPAPWAPPDPTTRLRRPPRARGLRRWRGVAAVVAVAVAFLAGYPPAGGVVAGLVVLVPLEKLFRRHDVPARRPGLGTDLTYLLAAPLLQGASVVAGVVVGVVSLGWLPGLALRPLVTAIPMGWRLVVGFVAFDLLLYWVHRLSHEVPVLWRFHAVHHSSRHLDWVAGARTHPLDGTFAAPVFAFGLGAGLPAEAVGAFAVFRAVTGIWAHLNVRWRLRPLQRLVMTPEFHHWHHANEPEALNTNYSVGLPVWDLAFGTWYMPSDRRPRRYGTDDAVPSGVIGQLVAPLRRRPRPAAA